jgi:hypothetical protein
MMRILGKTLRRRGERGRWAVRITLTRARRGLRGYLAAFE